MPEGHAIFRYAASHRELLAGHVVTAASPQGRFARGAARISGRRLLDVGVHGKHLFYRWERAETLHIHLGLYGKFRTFTEDPPPPTPNTRLTMAADGVIIYLAGPTTCELIEPSREEEIRSKLGPDPLKAGSPGNTAAELAANLARRTIPIGAAIIDQGVMAGFGNIYRAEVLFLTAVNPRTPANEVPRSKIDEIWETGVALLTRGVREGRIVTVKRPRGPDKTDGLYVYQRDRLSCRKCGGSISSIGMADRTIWWCETCQPR
jgi:endonuclease-8